MDTKLLKGCGFGALFLTCAAVTQVQAASLVLNFDFEFSGGSDPAGAAPWVVATFDDGGTPGSVSLTIDASGLSASEFIGSTYFNLDPVLDPTSLSFNRTDGTGPTQAQTNISTGVNEFKADGDGLYDILFDFPPPPGGGGAKFEAGETVTYNITGITTLTAASFDFLSAPDGGHGPFTAAAHVQGINADPDSGWIAPNPVPVPAAVWLFGSGLLGLIGVARRKA